MRTVDKLDKIGPDKVKVILLEDCGLEDAQAEEILKFIAIRTYGTQGELIAYISFAHFNPRNLTAQAIHDEVAAEMKNAGYDPETKSITPERLGAEFDVDAAQKALDAAAPELVLLSSRS